MYILFVVFDMLNIMDNIVHFKLIPVLMRQI